MRFTKMHGLGNDFVVVDDRRAAPVDWVRAAPQLCDRRRGVGADGVLLVQESLTADLRLRLFNADGSEAEMCGNGIRCCAVVARRDGMAGDRVVWETGAGPVRTELLADGSVRVDMGAPRFHPADIPVEAEGDGSELLLLDLAAGGRTVRAAVVGMGNPHCVVVTDDIAAAGLEDVALPLRTHLRFPRGANVEFVQVLTPTVIRQRTFERGVGETDACGTGACASVVALQRQGLCATAVDVELRGGRLRIEWPGSGPVRMTGPAVAVYEGEVAAVASVLAPS